MSKQEKMKAGERILFFLLGATFVWIFSTITLTAEYGRLSNHKDCNMSVENLQTLNKTKSNYYSNHR